MPSVDKEKLKEVLEKMKEAISNTCPVCNGEVGRKCNICNGTGLTQVKPLAAT
jgi:hypothetical protein